MRPDEPLVVAARPKSTVRPAPTPRPAPVPAEGERRGQLLLFPLGQRDDRPVVGGVSYRQVLEVLPLPAVEPAPFAPAHVRGVCWWRGRVLTVVDLSRRLGYPAAARAREKLLVARATPEGELVGLAVPEGLAPLRLPTPHGRGLEEALHGPVLGTFELSDRTLVLPDLAALAEAA